MSGIRELNNNRPQNNPFDVSVNNPATQGFDDHSVSGAEGVPAVRKSSQGIARLNDSVELPNQGIKQNPLQANGKNSPDNKNHVEAAGGPKTTVSFSPGYWRKEQIDGNGYKWLSFEFMPPSIKDSTAIDPEKAKEPLEKLAEMWKEVSDRAHFSNIRA